MQLKVKGHEAYIYTGGKAFDASLPTAVFIHGAQNDHSVWILQTRYFAHHGYGVLAVDLPGHGRSGGPALSSVEEMADWLLAVLDAAGVERATLIGHSMGSLIALETSKRAPQRVSKLALVGTAYPMKVSDLLLDAARDDEPAAIDMVNLWSHMGFVQKPSAPGPGFYMLGGSKRLMEQVSRRNPGQQVFLNDFKACNAYAGGEAAAAAADCPALVLMGKRDMMTTVKASGLLAKTLPRAKQVVLESCGHALMSEQPDAVLAALFEFAGSAGAAAA